jgi:hypothetical protein
MGADMRMTILAAVIALCIAPSSRVLADDAVSVERGLYISIIGGCHNCHTEGYRESDGRISPSKAMKGSSIGWRTSDYGTKYPSNLRLFISALNEDQFFLSMRTLQTHPMPANDMHVMHESDIRSLYQYIKSLGDPGEPPPSSVPPGKEPKTPYITIEPPTMPKP